MNNKETEVVEEPLILMDFWTLNKYNYLIFWVYGGVHLSSTKLKTRI